MRIETLKKKLNKEFNFSETYDSLEKKGFGTGSILLLPKYREKQRPWMIKAYNEWLKGDRTIVLVAPMNSCKYFKKYVTDIAEVRFLRDLTSSNYRNIKNMMIAVYWKKNLGEPNFTISFD